jgi:hypothetical protein
MQRLETVTILVLLLLAATPSAADVTGELARCQLEAGRSFPAQPNKGAQNWADRAANLQKRAESVETCMRAAGYKVTSECSAPLKTYESCLKIGSEVMHGPNASQYRALIGIRSAWTMSGTSGPRNDCRPIATSPAVGGAGWVGEDGAFGSVCRSRMLSVTIRLTTASLVSPSPFAWLGFSFGVDSIELGWWNLSGW